MAPGIASIGNVSVVLLTNDPEIGPDGSQLSFAPDQAHVINVGESARCLIILARGGGATLTDSESHRPRGDIEFLSKLPTTLRSIGESLLSSVRTHFSG